MLEEGLLDVFRLPPGMWSSEVTITCRRADRGVDRQGCVEGLLDAVIRCCCQADGVFAVVCAWACRTTRT